MCGLGYFKVSKTKAPKISTGVLFPYSLKLSLRKYFPVFACAYFHSITPRRAVARITNYFILMIKANPIVFDQIVITHLRFPSLRLFGTFIFIVAVGALNAFQILLVMCNCYEELNVSPPSEVIVLYTREVL